MAEENAVLMYKGRPLLRKDNQLYYGSMADSHIVMLQVLETKNVNGLDVASRVSVQLQLTDPAACLIMSTPARSHQTVSCSAAAARNVSAAATTTFFP